MRRSRSPQPSGEGYPQWAGIRSPHGEQSRSLIHSCVTFGPNVQLSTKQGQDGRLSQGLPGQNGPSSLLQACAAADNLGHSQTPRKLLEDCMGSFSLLLLKTLALPCKEGMLGKVSLQELVSKWFLPTPARKRKTFSWHQELKQKENRCLWFGVVQLTMVGFAFIKETSGKIKS